MVGGKYRVSSVECRVFGGVIFLTASNDLNDNSSFRGLFFFLGW
jgi:hypothetical protein